MAVRGAWRFVMCAGVLAAGVLAAAASASGARGAAPGARSSTSSPDAPGASEDGAGDIRPVSRTQPSRPEQPSPGAAEPSPTTAPSATAQLAQLRERVARVRRRLLTMARAQLDADNYALAADLLSAAVELGEEAPEAFFELAYCRGELGDEESAAHWYARAVNAVQERPAEHAALLTKLYNNYGATLVALGKPRDALRWYLKAVEADPGYAPVYFNLGRLYSKYLHDPHRALEAYRRHVALAGSRSVSARDAIRDLLEQMQPAGGEGDTTAAPAQ